MKRFNSKLLFVIVALLLVSLACNFSASTAGVKEVYMATDEAGDNRTTSFSQDQAFYAFVVLSSAPDDTALRAVWKIVNVEGEEPGTEIEATDLTAGSGTHRFSLTNQQLWPLGTYSVDIFMNDELQQTVEFSVE